MAGTTPTYGLPYPTGTDRVADGDNAIQALGVAVEDTLKLMKGWGTRFGSASSFPADSTYRPLVSIPLTGLPVGGVVLAIGTFVGAHPSAGAFLQTSFQNPPGLSHAGGFASPGIAKAQPAANAYTTITICDIFVATAANPNLIFYGFSNAGGSVTVDAETQAVAVRLF
jgi:hypothetical protein